MIGLQMFRTPWFIRWIFPRRTWGFPRSQNQVYLTFDDGPTREQTQEILDILSEKNVKATFFCVGENARKHPELMQRIVSLGHEIGNHTMHHDHAMKTSKNDYLRSINEASKYIDSSLFRPPYGRLPMHYAKGISNNYRIVMWSWLSYDFDPSVQETTILEKAQSIKAGDILILHDNVKLGMRTHKILPKIIDLVHQKELSFATIPVS